MILDKLVCWFDGDSIGTGTSKTSDALKNGLNMGVGEPVFALVQGNGVAGNSTVTIELLHCDTEGGSYTTELSMSVALADFNAGVYLPIPASCKEYTKIKVSGSNAFSAGTLTAGIVKDMSHPY